MNKFYFKYLASLYFKNVLIFILAFVLFYLFIDLLVNYKKLHLNTNIFLLYVAFTSLTAFYYILPISQILAMLFTQIELIKKNELIAFLSLGISKNSCIIPMFTVSFAISCVAIGLNYTNVAYSQNYKNNILKEGVLQKIKNDLFFKYDDNYIYIQRYDKDGIYGVEIINKDNEKINWIITAPKASYVDKKWVLENPEKEEFLEKPKYDIKFSNKIKLESKLILENFAPSILENFGAGDTSIKDAFFYLQNFSSNQNEARASIYRQSVFLLYAPFFGIALFYFLPLMPRFSDLSIVAVGITLISLIIYGNLFLLLRFAENGVLNPELSILGPICLIIVYSLIKFVKNR